MFCSTTSKAEQSEALLHVIIQGLIQMPPSYFCKHAASSSTMVGDCVFTLKVMCIISPHRSLARASHTAPTSYKRSGK